MDEDLPIEVDERTLPPPRARLVVTPGGRFKQDEDVRPPEPDIPTYAPPGYEAPEPEKVIDEAAEAEAAREIAAIRSRRSAVTERKEDTWNTAVDSFVKSFMEMPEKAIQSIDESFAGHYVPEGAKFQNDAGEYLDADMNVLPVTRKPTVLPATKDASSGEIEPAFPGALDVVTTPGTTSGRTASLAAGFRRPPGIGHNQGPPMPPTAAPPPMVPPQGPGRQIIRGHDDRDPTTWDKIYTEVYDDLHPLKVAQTQIDRSGVPINPEEMFYELARLTRGAYGRTEQALKNGTFDFNTLQNNGQSLQEVLKPVANDLDAFENFAVALRDIELHGRGINTGADIAQAQALVAGATQQQRQALSGLHAYQDRVLQYLADSGVMSQDAITNIRAANKHYVPFQRLMENSKDINAGRTLRPFDPVRRIKGSDRDILSPIETIIRNTHLFIDLAEKNRAMQALEQAAMSRGMTGLLRPVPRGSHPVHVSQQEVEAFLQGANVPIPPQFYGAPDNFAIFRPNAFNPKPNEIVVYRDGKPRVYQVDKDIAKAVNGMNAEQVSAVMNIASYPTRWLRSGVVLADLLVKNPLRDQFSAAGLSRNGFVPLYTYLKGLRHYFGNTAQYQDWLKHGGANAALTAMDRRYIEEYIGTLTKSGLRPTTMNPITWVTNSLSKLAELGEQPSRIGEYVSAVEPGPFRRLKGVQPKTKHQGAYESREVTTDFQRRGAAEWIKSMGRLNEFFNPNLQGPDRFIRSMKDDPDGTAFRYAAYIVMPTLLAYAYNRNDPRTKEIPRYERDTFWHFPVDKWQPITEEEAKRIPPEWKRNNDGVWEMNVGTVLRYPKPFEMGVAASAIERALDDYFTDHPEAWTDYFKSITNALVPQVIPTFARVPIEIASNFSFFRHRPIVSKRIESPKDRRLEYYPYTKESAKFLSNIVGPLLPESAMASPAMIEYLVNGWAGQWGSHVLSLSDKILGIAKPSKKGEKSESTLADIPFVRAVVTRMPTSGSQSVRDFYDNLNASTQTANTVRRLRRNDETEDADTLKAGQSTVRMQSTAKAIANLYRMIESIDRSTRLNGKQKRVAIDKYSLTIVLMAQEANKKYYEDQKRLKERMKEGVR